MSVWHLVNCCKAVLKWWHLKRLPVGEWPWRSLKVITDPPTHSVGRPVLFCSLPSVVICNTLQQRNVTHQGAARDGGPVVLCPVKATPCWNCSYWYTIYHFLLVVYSNDSILHCFQILTNSPSVTLKSSSFLERQLK